MMLWVSASHSGLDLLDLERGVPGRRVGREHPFEQGGARHDAVGQGDEVGEELFFAGNQAEAHAGKYVTRLLHSRYILVTAGASRPKKGRVRRRTRPATACCTMTLERQAQRELNLARRAEADRAADGAAQAAERAGRRRPCTAGRAARGSLRVSAAVGIACGSVPTGFAKFTRVEQVEHFAAELEVAAAAEREVLREEEVDLLEARAVDRVALQVAERAGQPASRTRPGSGTAGRRP